VDRTLPFLGPLRVVVLCCALLHANSGQATAQGGKGCLTLRVGEWSPQTKWGGDSVFVTSPSLVQLLPMPASAEEGRSNIRVERVSEMDWLPQKTWQQTSGDSLQLVFSNGHSGVILELPAVTDSAVGTAETFWDFPRELQTAVVRAVRIPCPANWRGADRL
jgi:hypothetical protein